MGRDVYFYIKNDPNDDDSWEYYCRYSMDTNNAEFDDTIREMLAVTAPVIEEETVEDEEERSNTTAGLVEPFVEEVTVEDEEETSNTTLALESSIPEDSTTVSMSNAPVALVSENMNDTSSSNFISISSTLSLLVLVMPCLKWFTLL